MIKREESSIKINEECENDELSFFPSIPSFSKRECHHVIDNEVSAVEKLIVHPWLRLNWLLPVGKIDLSVCARKCVIVFVQLRAINFCFVAIAHKAVFVRVCEKLSHSKKDRQREWRKKKKTTDIDKYWFLLPSPLNGCCLQAQWTLPKLRLLCYSHFLAYKLITSLVALGFQPS